MQRQKGIMALDEAQKQKVTGWINEGLKLSEIQKRMETDLGLKLTYLDVRLLVDDLKLMPKDPTPAPEPPKPAAPEAARSQTARPPGAPEPEPGLPEDEQFPEEDLAPEGEQAAPGVPGSVAVTVDRLTRPGALISGQVTFSDGNKAGWYLDQMGRLGVVSEKPGYKPSASDVQAFQMELQRQLQRMGY
jgi:hypothetical protein